MVDAPVCGTGDSGFDFHRSPLNIGFNNKGKEMSLILGLALGAFIGWNLPQPQFAKDIQAKVLGWFL